MCYCSYYYFHDIENDLYICFGENESCESKGYLYKNDNLKGCFNSITDCKSKGLKIFNNECYISCPENTKIDENDNTICICENYFYINEEGNYDCFDSDKICKTANDEFNYTNPETKECFKTKEDCLQKYNIENCTYFESQDSPIYYIFNNISYKNNCPLGTILDQSNPSSRKCICKEDSKIDPITGLIICIEALPEKYYTNKKECPYVYNGECFLECPENTCINPNLDDLVNCVNITPGIKKYNGICVEGIDSMIS